MSEAERLAMLEKHAPDTLLDDAELRAIAGFAAKLAGTPTALVSLVEQDRQRFLAREGLDVSETPRDQSFCQFAMTGQHVMEVADAREDPRFAGNPLVTGEPYIRFYAGAPLTSEEGAPLGALCVLSPEPRPEGLSAFQREGLAVLGQAVMRRLRDRRAQLEKKESDARFLAMGDAMPQMAWSTRTDGKTDYFNRRWQDFTGVPVRDHLGDGWIEALHEDDRATAQAAWSAAVESGRPYEVEYRMRRHDGEWRWILARGLPVTGPDGSIERWFGTNTDIHEHKMLAESRDLLARELSHRIKNIFTLVGSLLHLEGKASPEIGTAISKVSGRIGALARAHDYVRPDRSAAPGSRSSLMRVLAELFAPYRSGEGPQVTTQGDDIQIREEAVTSLALLFHELATNAAKYGALSTPQGTVTLDVAVGDDTTVFRWTERGGPEARETRGEGSGFGSRLIATAVEKQLKGEMERAWPRDGLAVTIRVPTARLT